MTTVEWVGGFAALRRNELGWTPGVVDLGGGLGIQYVEGRRPPSIGDFVGSLLECLEAAWAERELPLPQLVLEPGRSLVGPAGLTLYRVGVVKQAGDGTTFVAVDGGMSDNPRPQLYGASYTGLLANRADEPADGTYVVCGKHCESGDVMIHACRSRPAAGACWRCPHGRVRLSISNYVVPRPAAVLVTDGEARLIRRRETIGDLFELEVPSPGAPSRRVRY